MEIPQQFPARIAQQFPELQVAHIANTLKLLGEGCTIPFIARYRKELTGGMDEVKIAALDDALDKLTELEKRRATILNTIEELGKLTPELRQRIEECQDATSLEDLYCPYKPKRRTRAEVAREKGLEPLALFLLMQTPQTPEGKARTFVNPAKGVATADEALKGACDIVAEMVSEDERARSAVRHNFAREAVLTAHVVKGKESEAQKYRDYFDFSQPLKRCPSHRLLAIRRAESEGLLKVSISGDDGRCVERLTQQFVRGKSPAAPYLTEAVCDGYKRLLKPAIESEFAASAKEKADEAAIRIFADNLQQLLLAAPLGQKRVMAIDPGFRTGCKVVCLDAEGNLLHHEAIFPHPPKNDTARAAERVRLLVRQYQVEAISIGNGTAGRETERFVRDLQLPGVEVFSVSEDGASIYSASKVAREEFPDQDVTVRGAVSIGRRLMDPLAELVKIDPKSIGVGQYQYDVNQPLLKKQLDQTVEHCVNLVGVNVNTASRHLLTYISGLGPLLAQNIVNYRAEHGAFASRRELMKVPRMGEKAFEQSAGFLRIPGGKNPLDNSAVHPERYALVERMATDLHCSVSDLLQKAELRRQIQLSRYVSDEVGMPTLRDILSELDKPGRDPRKSLNSFEFDPTVHELEDLRPGMLLPGIITNITDFGCFVDVGVHTKGLVHVSQMADHYVKSPAEVVSLHQQVEVRVLAVDLDRQRLQLSLKKETTTSK